MGLFGSFESILLRGPTADVCKCATHTVLALLAVAILLVILQADTDRNPADDELARAIAARSQQMWQAYWDKDAAAHTAILTDDYTSIDPDGTMHGPATAQQTAAAAIAAFTFSERKVWPLGDNAALSTYFADVELPAGTQPAHIRFAASEVWVRQQGEWKCKFYQGTTADNP